MWEPPEQSAIITKPPQAMLRHHAQAVAWHAAWCKARCRCQSNLAVGEGWAGLGWKVTDTGRLHRDYCDKKSCSCRCFSTWGGREGGGDGAKLVPEPFIVPERKKILLSSDGFTRALFRAPILALLGHHAWRSSSPPLPLSPSPYPPAPRAPQYPPSLLAPASNWLKNRPSIGQCE